MYRRNFWRRGKNCPVIPPDRRRHLQGAGNVLRWTGHPLVDVGVATILAFTEKDDPSAVTPEDLERVRDYLLEHYPVQTSLMSITFTINSDYSNPSVRDAQARRQRALERVLHLSQPDHAPEVCALCGRPAASRYTRQHLPMLTAEEVVNFFPNATAGLPMCAYCVFAAQAYPLGSAKVLGKMLSVWSESAELMIEVAARFLDRNRAYLALGGGGKYPDLKFPGTLLLHTLGQLVGLSRRRAAGIVAYHHSNSGQGPALTVLAIPSQALSFLREVRDEPAWKEIVERSWDRPKRKSGDVEPGMIRNAVYEDFMELPYNARRFLRRHLLTPALREPQLASWKVVGSFMEEVMSMEPGQVEAIRTLGDGLADYIRKENDRRLFQGLYLARGYREFRGLLLKVTLRAAQDGVLLCSLEQFLQAFQLEDDYPTVGWDLARDLILLRVIEQLHAHGWVQRHPDVVKAAEEPEEVPA